MIKRTLKTPAVLAHLKERTCSGSIPFEQVMRADDDAHYVQPEPRPENPTTPARKAPRKPIPPVKKSGTNRPAVSEKPKIKTS